MEIFSIETATATSMCNVYIPIPTYFAMHSAREEKIPTSFTN